MFELMIFMILFFIGLVAAQWYVVVRLDNNFKRLSEEHAQLRVIARAMESRLERLCEDAGAKGAESEPENEDDVRTAVDPLLRLNFEEPRDPRADFERRDLELNLDLVLPDDKSGENATPDRG